MGKSRSSPEMENGCWKLGLSSIGISFRRRGRILRNILLKHAKNYFSIETFFNNSQIFLNTVKTLFNSGPRRKALQSAFLFFHGESYSSLMEVIHRLLVILNFFTNYNRISSQLTIIFIRLSSSSFWI